MGASSSKTTESESKKMTSESKTNDKKNKKSKKKLKTINFEVEMFTEDENNSKTSSNNNNKEENENSENNDSDGNSSLIELRIYDYSSSDSDSSIDFEVIDPNDQNKKKSKNKSPKKEEEEEKNEEEEEKKEEEDKKEEEEKNEEDEKKEEENKEEEEEKKEEEKKEEEEKKDDENNKNDDANDTKEKEEEKPKKNAVKKKKKKKADESKKKLPNMKKIQIPIEEESDSSEFESEKIDSPHPSELIESNMKEIIYSEYSKNKKYFTPQEKKKSEEISKKSYESCTHNKYRKNILLHNDEITSICALDAKTKSIAYATSSLDRTIKFWSAKFKIIDTISNLITPSLYLCEFDSTNILSAEGVYIKMYDLSSEIYECKFIFRDHIEEIRIIHVIITRNTMNFLSGGKDKIMRLWTQDNESPIRYYEGHQNTIISIKNIARNKKLIVSISEDKKCIIWEVNNSNMIYEFDNYFTPNSLIETKKGFCIGAYDNKIRFYNEEYSLKKCLTTKFYGNNLLLGDDNNIFCADATGKINLVNLEKNELVIVFEGSNSDINQIIKSYNWDPEPSGKEEKEKSKFYESKMEDRTIITVNKDGYVYTYKNEIFKKLKVMPKEIFKKETKKDNSSTEKTESNENKSSDRHHHHRKKVLKKKDKDDKDDKSKSKSKKVTFSDM